MKCIREGGTTPNKLRVWLEEMTRTDVNLPKGKLGVVLRVCNGGGIDEYK